MSINLNVEGTSGEEKRFYSRILRETVCHSIAYFDIFSYPLKLDEIVGFMGIGGFSRDAVNEVLLDLTEHGILFKHDDFFGLHADRENVLRRMRGNIQAAAQMPTAKRWARLISYFPFVRGVLISGSLSKGYMDEKSDLDFFVITATGRLWITRMLLVVFKRIFLFGSHRNFCVNYFVDINLPKIAEENIFTATELATLIPLYGADEYNKLVRSNLWLSEYLPNWQQKPVDDVGRANKYGLNRFLEFIINCCAPEKTNRWFKALTAKRWKRIYEKDYSKNDFDVVFKSDEHVSKNHPQNFQKKVLSMYQNKVDDIDQRLMTIYAGAMAQSAV